MKVTSISSFSAQALPLSKSKSASAENTSPAYEVSLSQNAAQRMAAEWIKGIQSTSSPVRTLSKLPQEEQSAFHEKMQLQRKQFGEDLAKKYGQPFDEADFRLSEDIPSNYSDGLDAAISAIELEQRLAADGVMANPLQSDVQAHFDLYKNAGQILSNGGLSDFRAFNLNLAGIAKAGLMETEDARSAYHIGKGDYTGEEVQRAASFARTLQDASGVFVAMDFDYVTTTYATGYDFSYNGTLAKIGTKELSFMAEHTEAIRIWKNAAQGRYQNAGQIKAALQNGGFSATADAYETMLSQSKRDMDTAFSHTAGKLWAYTTGYGTPQQADAAYQSLQTKLRGNDAASLSYRADELNEAEVKGRAEKSFLESLVGAREPADIRIDKDGRAHLASRAQESGDATKEDDTSDALQNYAARAIRDLKEKIAEIREQNLPLAQKQKLIESLRLQILSYQNMKLRDHRKNASA